MLPRNILEYRVQFMCLTCIEYPNSYDCTFWICILHVTQACFTAGFVDGANAGAALYEGWCTGEDHSITKHKGI